MGDQTLVSAIKIIGPPDLVNSFQEFLRGLPNSILELMLEISVPFCMGPPQTCPLNSIATPSQIGKLRTPFVLRLDPQDSVTVCPIDDSMAKAISRHVLPGYDSIYHFLSNLADIIAKIVEEKSLSSQQAILKKLAETRIICSTKHALVVTPSSDNTPTLRENFIALGGNCTLGSTNPPGESTLRHLTCEQYTQYTLSAPDGKGIALPVLAITEKTLSEQCTVSTNDQPPVEAIPNKQHDNKIWFGMTLLVSLSMSFLSQITKTIRFNDKSNTGKLLNLFLDYSNYIVLISLFYAVPTSALLWVTTHFFNIFLKQHSSSKFKKKFGEFLVFAMTQLFINYTHQKENDFTATLMILTTFSELVLGDMAGYYLARAVTTLLKEEKPIKLPPFIGVPKKSMKSKCSSQNQKSESKHSPVVKPTTNTTLNAKSTPPLKTSESPKKKGGKLRKLKKQSIPKPQRTTPITIKQTVAESPISKEVDGLHDDTTTEPPIAEEIDGLHDDTTAESPIAEEVDGLHDDTTAESPIAEEVGDLDDEDAADAQSLSSNGQSDDSEDIDKAPPATITSTATPHMTVICCDGHHTQHPDFSWQLITSMPHNINEHAPLIIKIKNQTIPKDSKLYTLLSTLDEMGIPGSIIGGAALQIIECLFGVRRDKELNPSDIDCLIDSAMLLNMMNYKARQKTYQTVTGEPQVSYDFLFNSLAVEVSVTELKTWPAEVTKQSRKRHTDVKSCLVLMPCLAGEITIVLPNALTVNNIIARQFSLNELHLSTQPKWVFMALAMLCEGYTFNRSPTASNYDNACLSLQGFSRFHCVTKYLLRYGSPYLRQLAQAKTTSRAVLDSLIICHNFDYTDPSYNDFFDELIATTKKYNPQDQYTVLIIALIAPRLLQHNIPDPNKQTVFARYIDSQLIALGIQTNKQTNLPEHIAYVKNAGAQCIQICTKFGLENPVLSQTQERLQRYLNLNRSSNPTTPEVCESPTRKKPMKNILLFTDPPDAGLPNINPPTCLPTKKHE